MGALGLCGCAVVGPRSISGGRGVYAETINITEDEQILNMIVRQRYDESFAMISVASVTASLRFGVQAGTNIGIGDSDNFAGNLVPLSVGVAYEENPTISYVPLSGDDFMRRMLSPVSTTEWLLVGGAAKHPGHVFDLAVRRVNGLRNRVLGEEPSSPDFARFVDLYGRLRRAGVLDIVQDPEPKLEREMYLWDIHDYEDAHGESLHEMLVLLGIEAKPDGSAIFLPVLTAPGSSSSAIHLETRSAVEVLRMFGAGVEIPAAHLEAGIVEPYSWKVPAGRRFITIRSSEKQWWGSRPDDAAVAIRFRDHWFYIDATDTNSKRAFQFLRTFIGMRLADPSATHRAPILTVPVN
jgi:hypothetical protein